MGFRSCAIVELDPDSNSALKVYTTDLSVGNLVKWTTYGKLKPDSVIAYRLYGQKKQDLDVSITPTPLMTELDVNINSNEGRVFLEYANKDAMKIETSKGRISRKSQRIYSYNDVFHHVEVVFVLLPRWGCPTGLRRQQPRYMAATPRRDTSGPKSGANFRKL